MPYSKKYDKKRKKWIITKKGSDKVLGTHPNEEAANKQLAALYAQEEGKPMMDKKEMGQGPMM